VQAKGFKKTDGIVHRSSQLATMSAYAPVWRCRRRRGRRTVPASVHSSSWQQRQAATDRGSPTVSASPLSASRVAAAVQLFSGQPKTPILAVAVACKSQQMAPS